MSNKKMNEELQSRREFFKKAAKVALPVIGAIALSQMPISMQAKESGCTYCQGGCYGCTGTCSGKCADACTSCSGLCQGTCKDMCYNTGK